MSSLIDSVAQFRTRASEVGFSVAQIDSFVASGVDTLSKLAFAIGQPGQTIPEDAATAFLQTAFARAPVLQEVAVLKRLVFEAHTYLVATLRQSVDQDEGQPRKVAFAERNTRMQALRATLAGVCIEGELEPAHTLLDKACNMFDKNVLTYLEPSVCISRSLEIQGTTKHKELTLEKGSLVIKHDDKLTASTDSEIKLHYAFVRRAVSFEFAQIMSFAQHNQWETYLFESLHRDVPPGYAKASLSQVIMCDKAAWSRLATLAPSIRQRPDGTYPLGEALLGLRHDPHIALHLAPLSRPAGVHPENPDRFHPYNPNPPKGDPKGKGNPKGKGKGRGAPPMPKELRGKYHRLQNGEPLCFAFNSSSGCQSKAKAGEKCNKGWHLCAEPKCQQPHSLQNHK